MERLRPVQVRTIHQELQERIREYILANRLRPGDLLPTEAQLSEQLGVSRPILRESLRALESLGVIHSRRGEGRYVSGFQLEPLFEGFAYGALFEADQIQEILEVRQRLEIVFIPDVVALIDEQCLEDLRRLVSDMRVKLALGEVTWQTDLQFHRRVYEVVGNRVLLRLLDVFWMIFGNLRDRSLFPPRDPKGNVEGHAAILAALEARDVPRAQEAIALHFEDLRVRLRQAKRAESNGVSYLQPDQET